MFLEGLANELPSIWWTLLTTNNQRSKRLSNKQRTAFQPQKIEGQENFQTIHKGQGFSQNKQDKDYQLTWAFYLKCWYYVECQYSTLLLNSTTVKSNKVVFMNKNLVMTVCNSDHWPLQNAAYLHDFKMSAQALCIIFDQCYIVTNLLSILWLHTMYISKIVCFKKHLRLIYPSTDEKRSTPLIATCFILIMVITSKLSQ